MFVTFVGPARPILATFKRYAETEVGSQSGLEDRHIANPERCSSMYLIRLVRTDQQLDDTMHFTWVPCTYIYISQNSTNAASFRNLSPVSDIRHDTPESGEIGASGEPVAPCRGACDMQTPGVAHRMGRTITRAPEPSRGEMGVMAGL
jgi:hypothetical protein